MVGVKNRMMDMLLIEMLRNLVRKNIHNGICQQES